MTAVEAYELISHGGATDFARVIETCEQLGPYSLIDGLAVNCYVEPVYTMDADIVMIASHLPTLANHSEQQGFRMEEHPHSLNAARLGSQFRIQFSRDVRYQAFPGRCVEAEVLGIRVKIACLRDVVQGKLWAYGDPTRRLSNAKRTS